MARRHQVVLTIGYLRLSTTIHQRPFLEVRDLEVRFAQQSVLRKIDLSIPTGQTLAIIGESGCGKTVLLKTLIGLIEPFAGSVIFDGQDMAQLSERQLTDQRNRFGFLFQNASNSFPKLMLKHSKSIIKH